MRHQKRGRKLGRDSAHRKSLYANLTSELIQHGRIRTTLAKAKEVRPVAERMITLGKRGDLHAHRQAVAFLRSKSHAHQLFSEVAPRYAELADTESHFRGDWQVLRPGTHVLPLVLHVDRGEKEPKLRESQRRLRTSSLYDFYGH